MKNNLGKLVNIVLLIIIVTIFPEYYYAQEKSNYSVGLNVFMPLSYWENTNLSEDYSYLGFGSFLSPEFEIEIENYYFNFGVMFSYYHITGPDDLTLTGPDHDIDTDFNSKIHRNEINIQIGYCLSEFFRIDAISRYVHLNLTGEPKQKLNNQPSLDYIERGFLFGPQINLFYPHIYSKQYTSLKLNYIFGNLDYEHWEPKKDKILTQILTTTLSYNISLRSNIDLGIAIKSEYFFKSREYQEISTSSDLWFIGINVNVLYHL